MDIETFREFCLSLPETSECLPFDESTLVFKVRDKLFALTNIDTYESVNLKCDPEEAIALREQYDAVIPGFHMNKKHWNTIKLDGSIPNELLKKWIYDSYQLVFNSFSKKSRS